MTGSKQHRTISVISGGCQRDGSNTAGVTVTSWYCLGAATRRLEFRHRLKLDFGILVLEPPFFQRVSHRWAVNGSARILAIPMRHVLSATVQNVPGVLAHVSGMLASRGYNIDSLAVGETDDPGVSRMTFVLRGDDRVLEQVRRQLQKIVTVVSVMDISSRNYVERDLMLIKVSAPAGPARSNVKELAEIFRGRVVDVASDSVIVEISGTESKIEGFIDLVRPLGIQELVRTGRIAMVRGSSPTELEANASTAAAG